MSLVAALERIQAARLFVHDATCVQKWNFPCRNCAGVLTVATALDHLDAHPRDARGARRIFHDAVCSSGCGPEDDHADRTQAPAVAALRKFRASEALR